VWFVLLLHEVQRRGGSCPELSCLRSEEVLSFAAFITRELINPGVCCIHVFFSKETCFEICVAIVLSLSELSSLFYSRPHLYTCFVFLFWLYVHPWMGYDWLCFSIQINQPTRCNSFTSLLFGVYVWLNTFRAPLRPSSGAYNCTKSLWFYRWRVAVGAVLVVVWQVFQTTMNSTPTTTLQR
jgi:hypothetical protein